MTPSWRRGTQPTSTSSSSSTCTSSSAPMTEDDIERIIVNPQTKVIDLRKLISEEGTKRNQESGLPEGYPEFVAKLLTLVIMYPSPFRRLWIH